MKKTLSALVFALAVLLTAAPAGAHEVADHHADCAGITVTFKDFPDHKNDVTIKAVSAATRSFDGPDGSVHVSWADVGDDTSRTGDHPYTVSWNADGGGSKSFVFESDGCGTTTTTAPATTSTTARTTTTAPTTTAAPTTTTAPPRSTTTFVGGRESVDTTSTSPTVVAKTAETRKLARTGNGWVIWLGVVALLMIVGGITLVRRSKV